MKISPYLMFDGRTEEAIEFYKKNLGATVSMLMRFKEAPPEANCDPSSYEKIMHAAFEIGGNQIMASDGDCSGKGEFKGISLTINLKDEAEADRLFNALGDGGQVQMPLSPTFFAKKFGMVADKFGVNWMVVAE
ncbi:MAG: VOC family protein [Pseudolabrys sp.]|nr:VOC family protein [Pseudolabrys sp.]